jgi:hypothetical protein
LWLIEADVFQMPHLHKHFTVSGYTMKPYQLLASIFILTLSCNNNKSSNAVTSDTTKTITPKSFVDTSKQATIDSSYLNMVEQIKENPYSDNYDTIIKGGFSISYYHDKEDQYLIYKKGQKVIDTIGACSLGLLYKNLGYIGADFDKTFVFVNSFGGGNPHYIQLLDKETAKNLIPDGSAWVDVDTLKQVLLYSKADVPLEKDSMTLFDTKNMTQSEYAFPKEIFDEPEKLNRIRLIKVTDKTFTIEYEFKARTKTRSKKYSR